MSLSISAIIMFLFGSFVLYGGLVYFLYIALKRKINDKKDLNELNR